MTRILAVAFMLLHIHPLFARANMIMEEESGRLKVFFTMTDREGRRAVLKGKIISFSSKDILDKGDLFGKAQEKNKATVRLYSAEAINEGDILYVVNQKNLIVAKMEVRTIFKSRSFGDMLVGYGNFMLGSVGDRVVREEADEVSKYSYIHKARGDYYENVGERGNAISEYKSAIQLDRNDPSARLALGMIYLKDGLDQFALREFQEAYRNINRMYDREDRFILLRSIADIRFREVYESFIPDSLKEDYRKEAIGICRDALRLYPESERMHYYLGVFHYRAVKPDDRKARDYFLKVLELNPSHPEACVGLSELYYRHDNMEKARLYAEKALGADSGNERARSMLRNIEKRQGLK